MVRVAGGSFSMGYKRAGSPRSQKAHRPLGTAGLLGSQAGCPRSQEARDPGKPQARAWDCV